MKKLVTLALVMVLALPFAACGAKRAVQSTMRDALNGKNAEYTIRVGESGKWTPFSGASGVAFSNSNNSVISIADDGKTVTFTGLAVGKSIITASYKGGESTAVVNVAEDAAGNPGNSESGGESSGTGESGTDGPGPRGGGGYIGERPKSGPGSSIVKPARIPDFAAEYKYAPPKDMYIIIWNKQEFPQPDAPGPVIRNFVAQIGEVYSYSWVYDENTTPIQYAETRVNFATGRGSSRMLGASEWQVDDYDYTDTEDELRSVGIFCFFEVLFMPYFRALMNDDLSRLADFYVGNEVLTLGTKQVDFDCWVFDTQGFNGLSLRFWIDPADCCCMMYENYGYTYSDGSVGSIVETVADYDLAYTEWTTER